MDPDVRSQQLFVWMDRAFWLLWVAFPLLIWLLVTEILAVPDRLAELAPDQAACIAALPQIAGFTSLGQAVFWASIGTEFLVYAILMALAHVVIHRCAVGRVLVAEMIGVLRWVGLIIAGWPVLDLVLANLQGMALRATGDVPIFSASFALDVTVVGVGLVIITISVAMRQAVRLREDADLTI